jgi:glycosyltransferase
VSERDAGIYDAMNKGLALASGDFVGFLNADDFLASEDVISEIARAASAPDVGAVCGDLVYVRNGRTDEVLRYWRCGEFSPSRLKFGWMPPHPTLYVRRSLLAEVVLLQPKLRGSRRLRLHAPLPEPPNMRVAYVPRVLVKMRTGGASNRSLTALLNKSREDPGVLRRNRVGGS